jgi:hypothetical protein
MTSLLIATAHPATGTPPHFRRWDDIITVIKRTGGIIEHLGFIIIGGSFALGRLVVAVVVVVVIVVIVIVAAAPLWLARGVRGPAGGVAVWGVAGCEWEGAGGEVCGGGGARGGGCGDGHGEGGDEADEEGLGVHGGCV